VAARALRSDAMGLGELTGSSTIDGASIRVTLISFIF